MKPFLLVGELAEIISVSKSTIWNWVRDDLLEKDIVISNLGEIKIRTAIFEKAYNVDLSDKFLTFNDILGELGYKPTTVRSWKDREQLPKELFSKIVGVIRIQQRIWERYKLGEPLADKKIA